jgi:hypothetical protein
VSPIGEIWRANLEGNHAASSRPIYMSLAASPLLYYSDNIVICSYFMVVDRMMSKCRVNFGLHGFFMDMLPCA